MSTMTVDKHNFKFLIKFAEKGQDPKTMYNHMGPQAL